MASRLVSCCPASQSRALERLQREGASGDEVAHAMLMVNRQGLRRVAGQAIRAPGHLEQAAPAARGLFEAPGPAEHDRERTQRVSSTQWKASRARAARPARA
jgi:hypothetical protein